MDEPHTHPSEKKKLPLGWKGAKCKSVQSVWFYLYIPVKQAKLICPARNQVSRCPCGLGRCWTEGDLKGKSSCSSVSWAKNISVGFSCVFSLWKFISYTLRMYIDFSVWIFQFNEKFLKSSLLLICMDIVINWIQQHMRIIYYN